MEIHVHSQLLDLLHVEFGQKQAEISFTQWDGDSEDEETIQFKAELLDVKLSDNEFKEKDLYLLFQTTDEEQIEILMEIPQSEEDLGSFEESRLRIFGTESEIILAK